MKFGRRYSSFFPNPLNNHLGVVHRQGQNFAFIPLFLVSIFFISTFVVYSRRLIFYLSLLNFSIIVFSGFILYFLLTLILRKFFYNLIIHYQGIQHPKFLVSFSLIFLDYFIISNPLFSMILYIVVILSSFDVIIQNQMHDIISTIGPNSWEITTLIPIYQIPFEKDFHFGTDVENNYILVLKYREKGKLNSFQSLKSVSPAEYEEFLENSNINTNLNYLSLFLINVGLDNKDNSKREVIEIFRTKEILQMKEFLYELRNLIKYKIA